MADVEITLKRNNSGTADRLLPTTSWSQVEGKPSTFTPSAHTHSISDVTNLQTSLDAKAADNAVVKLTGNQTVAGQKTFSDYTFLDAGAQIGLNSGTTSDHLYFNTGQYYTGPSIKGVGELLYRNFYINSYKIADEQTYPDVVKGSLSVLFSSSGTLVTASTSTFTSFALTLNGSAYTPSASDKFLVIMSAGSNNSLIEKGGCIVEYGTFTSTTGMAMLGFFGYGGLSGTNIIGTNYGCQWYISGSTLQARYPTSSAWNSTTLSAATFYIHEIYRIN